MTKQEALQLLEDDRELRDEAIDFLDGVEPTDRALRTQARHTLRCILEEG